MSQAEAKKSNVVTMKDGRSIDFGVRGKLKKDIQTTETGVKLIIDVINGDTHTIEFSADHALAKTLLGYGLSQKITDTVVKAEDGDDISLGVESIVAQLQAGVWTNRATGEGLARGFADLLEAIRRVRSYEVGSEQHQALKAALISKSEEELKNLRSNGAIKGIIAQIQAEKAAERAAKLGAAAVEDEVDALEGL